MNEDYEQIRRLDERLGFIDEDEYKKRRQINSFEGKDLTLGETVSHLQYMAFRHAKNHDIFTKEKFNNLSDTLERYGFKNCERRIEIEERNKNENM